MLKSGIWQSTIVHFSSGTVLKRAAFANPKCNFQVIEPHCQMTAENVAERDIVLCVGDTTFLDYGSITAKTYYHQGRERFNIT